MVMGLEPAIDLALIGIKVNLTQGARGNQALRPIFLSVAQQLID
ncbi:unnamed protein product [marine sediment metagenome]|uniref:Uncharacterized protein n=1 Tax=marine sediment metagenome TaxID=412755 RepID=X1JG75_9ZZZZ